MTTDHRPDPDDLLEHVKKAETRRGRGRLKVFFGASAGVGKTYAMLQAAQEQRAQSTDVMVGWVETHGRAETEALLEGLEILPSRLVPYRGITLREFESLFEHWVLGVCSVWAICTQQKLGIIAVKFVG